MGICHSYAPDGRCISLLKILLTNWCQYDCLYCVNRVSKQRRPRPLHDRRGRAAHARLLPAQLHRRPVPVQRHHPQPDYTMEQVVEVARRLREEHDFRGYIHLKTIPTPAAELLQQAGRYGRSAVDQHRAAHGERLAALAPEKDVDAIRRSMARLRVHIDDAKAERTDNARQPLRSLPGAPASRAKSPSVCGRAARARR
jgi:predicted DNA-binding helix-hairpin-helix protein